MEQNIPQQKFPRYACGCLYLHTGKVWAVSCATAWG